MAGPLHPESDPGAKINSFMAVPKPSGDRRQVCSIRIKVKQIYQNPPQVGNLSAPPGASFNEGIPAQLLQQWTVVQTTARTFSEMLARAGKSCIMSKSDMVAAYKGEEKLLSTHDMICLQQYLFVRDNVLFNTSNSWARCSWTSG